MIKNYVPLAMQWGGFLLMLLSLFYLVGEGIPLFSFYPLAMFGTLTAYAGIILRRKGGNGGEKKRKYDPYLIQILGFFLLYAAVLYPAGVALSRFSFYALSIIGSLTVVTGGFIERRSMR